MAHEQQSFGAIFRGRLKKLEEDARRVGINMTVVCKEAGVGRSTPDRWHRNQPKTVEIIEKMEAVVEKHRQEKLSELGRV